MGTQLESSRLVGILDHNYLHREQLEIEGCCIDWRPSCRRPLSFISGNISKYDEVQSLLILHYHSIYETNGDLRMIRRLTNEAHGMFGQIANSILQWRDKEQFTPRVTSIIAATYPLMSGIVRRLVPIFSPIGIIPYATAYSKSLWYLNSELLVSTRHKSSNEYEILAASADEFMKTYLKR